jgi:hypothetical protein
MAVAKKGAGKGKRGTARRVGTAAGIALDVADHVRSRRRTPRLSAIVEKALPGWELAETAAQQPSGAEDNKMSIDQEPSISYLKRKFLGEDVSDSSEEALFEEQDSRKPVRVKPKRGGQAKTADVTPDGHVTIVQG